MASKQITSMEQWLLLLVPIGVVFGLTVLMGRKGRGVQGLGCNCGGPDLRGLGNADQWVADQSYEPYGAALAARQQMIAPMPWK